MYSAQSKCMMLFLCGLCKSTGSQFIIRSRFTAAVPRLIVGDANFNFFSYFVHSHGFRFLEVWCLTVFASSGHHVLLKSGLQDTLSFKLLKKMCNTVNELTYDHWVRLLILGKRLFCLPGDRSVESAWASPLCSPCRVERRRWANAVRASAIRVIKSNMHVCWIKRRSQST